MRVDAARIGAVTKLHGTNRLFTISRLMLPVYELGVRLSAQSGELNKLVLRYF